MHTFLIPTFWEFSFMRQTTFYRDAFLLHITLPASLRSLSFKPPLLCSLRKTLKSTFPQRPAVCLVSFPCLFMNILVIVHNSCPNTFTQRYAIREAAVATQCKNAPLTSLATIRYKISFETLKDNHFLLSHSYRKAVGEWPART